jgi:hypothetical protein
MLLVAAHPQSWMPYVQMGFRTCLYKAMYYAQKVEISSQVASTLFLYLRSSTGHVAVSSYQGEILKLSKITRSEMGAYLCIASNGVPPSVSKRIMVNVHCEFHTLYCSK